MDEDATGLRRRLTPQRTNADTADQANDGKQRIATATVAVRLAGVFASVQKSQGALHRRRASRPDRRLSA